MEAGPNQQSQQQQQQQQQQQLQQQQQAQQGSQQQSAANVCSGQSQLASSQVAIASGQSQGHTQQDTSGIAVSEAGPVEEGVLLARVHVPELYVSKCLQFPKDQLVWDVKQQCLASLPKLSFSKSLNGTRIPVPQCHRSLEVNLVGYNEPIS
ncbi:hypothetical protein HZH66_015389 [Vespula vulgaris]|uniref:Uncharacterized protein n=1 Tax=Vespula vulgaris TaxID=7454 RepID=A0A834MLM6_VESVU|nr:hypothetical protein HZH66_015389 [Vespula vulgaris]